MKVNVTSKKSPPAVTGNELVAGKVYQSVTTGYYYIAGNLGSIIDLRSGSEFDKESTTRLGTRFVEMEAAEVSITA